MTNVVKMNQKKIQNVAKTSNCLLDKNKIFDLYLKNNIISFNFLHYYQFSSGYLSPIYIDNRLWFSFPEDCNYLIDKIIQHIKNLNLKFDVICAIPNSGVPFGAIIANKLDKPFIYMRKHIKKYGIEDKLYEGKILKSSKILIFEDVITTGNTVKESIKKMQLLGYKMTAIISIYNYKNGLAKISEVPLFSFCNLAGLIHYLKQHNVLKSENYNKIIEFEIKINEK